MLNKFFSFFILGFFSLISTSFIIFPLVFLMELIVFKTQINSLNIKTALLISIFISSIGVIFTILINFVYFYSSFLSKKKAKKFIDYTSTQYNKMLDICQRESYSSIPLEGMKVSLLVDDNFKPLVFSFGSYKENFIVFSVGMLDKFVELIKQDPAIALNSFQSLITHEITHLKHYDFITYDFYKSQLNLALLLTFLYKILLFPLKLLFIVLPIPFVRKWLLTFFETCIMWPILFFVSLPIVLFKKIYGLLNASILQFNEKMADAISVKLFGFDNFNIMLENIPNYSTLFSLHKQDPELRKMKISNIAMDENFKFDPDYKDIFLLSNTLILLLFLITIVISFFFVNLEELNIIKLYFINLFSELIQSENFFLITVMNIKKLFF